MIQFTIECCSAPHCIGLFQSPREESLNSFTVLCLFSVLAPIPNNTVRANQSTKTMAAMSALETMTPKTVALVGLTLLVAAWLVQVRPGFNSVTS